MSGRRAGVCLFPPRIGGASSRSNLLTACKVRDFSAKPSLPSPQDAVFCFIYPKNVKWIWRIRRQSTTKPKNTIGAACFLFLSDSSRLCPSLP